MMSTGWGKRLRHLVLNKCVTTNGSWWAAVSRLEGGHYLVAITKMTIAKRIMITFSMTTTSSL